MCEVLKFLAWSVVKVLMLNNHFQMSSIGHVELFGIFDWIRDVQHIEDDQRTLSKIKGEIKIR